MTPNGSSNTAVVTTTVFDLASFADLKLAKTVNLPAQPTTLEEALAAVGNDKAKLLEVIHDGLIAAAKDAARESINKDTAGWMYEDEDGKDVPYSGAFADEKQGKLIDGAVLTLSKLQGFSKSLDPEQKRKIKENVRAQLRATPALLGMFAGSNG